MRVCVVCDSAFLMKGFMKIICKERYKRVTFDFCSTPENATSEQRYGEIIRPIRLAEQSEVFFANYSLFLSLHSKQIFPKGLVTKYRCINVHPGLNPYNRGMFPHVFSMINGLPAGVTIHLMDTELDHGPIIYQREVKIGSSETSADVYRKIQETEIELLEDHLTDLLNETYTVHLPQTEGNINTMKDFKALCEIDLNRTATYGEVLDFLRAMTFDEYQNAWYLGEDGKRKYVNLRISDASLHNIGGGIS